jgi:hypothetical protein
VQAAAEAAEVAAEAFQRLRDESVASRLAKEQDAAAIAAAVKAATAKAAANAAFAATAAAATLAQRGKLAAFQVRRGLVLRVGAFIVFSAAPV